MESEISRNLVRLFREIYSNSLKHPHITSIKESFFTPNGDFITVSELAENNLENYRTKHGALPSEKIAEIMFQICLGLEYTH